MEVPLHINNTDSIVTMCLADTEDSEVGSMGGKHMAREDPHGEVKGEMGTPINILLVSI